MRVESACCIVLIALTLSGCGSDSKPPPAKSAGSKAAPALPSTIGGGSGSQNGNYAEQIAGEVTGSSGERCVIYVWDRPLTKDLALRLKSSSCESQERPGWMISKELSRTVIPIAESSLKDQPLASE